MATEQTTEDAPSKRQFKSVEKAMSLPIVKKGVDESYAFYKSPTAWISKNAKALVVPYLTDEGWARIGPYVDKPLAYADEKLASGIEELERRVPLIKEEPAVIMQTAKDAVHAKIPEMRSAAEPYVQSLNEKSRETGNTLLGYWSWAAQGASAGASHAGQWLGQRQEGQQTTTGESPPAAAPAAAPVAAPWPSLWETLSNKFISKD